MSNYYDKKNFEAVMKSFTRIMRSISLQELTAAGYYGIELVPYIVAPAPREADVKLLKIQERQHQHETIFAQLGIDNEAYTWCQLVRATLPRVHTIQDVCAIMCAHPDLTMLDVQILSYAINGVADYAAATGRYPANPGEFIRYCLNFGYTSSLTF